MSCKNLVKRCNVVNSFTGAGVGSDHVHCCRRLGAGEINVTKEDRRGVKMTVVDPGSNLVDVSTRALTRGVGENEPRRYRRIGTGIGTDDCANPIHLQNSRVANELGK